MKISTTLDISSGFTLLKGITFPSVKCMVDSLSRNCILQPADVDEEDEHRLSFQEDSYRPFPRKHAWRSPESPLTSPNPRKVIPPIQAPSVLSEQTSPPDETHRSHRTSELSSEW